MSELDQEPIYKSINRSFLLLGADRELALCLLLLSVLLVSTGLSLLSTIAGICVWVGGLYLLQMMARKDPLMVRIFFNFWQNYRQKVYMSAAAPGTPPHQSRSSGISG